MSSMFEGLPVVSPQPTGSRRVQASRKRRRPDEDLNLASKLLKRQLGGSRGSGGSRSRHVHDAADSYRNITLQGRYDTFCNDQQQLPDVLPRQQRRSKVLEIISAQDIVFALINSGTCTAFNRVSGRRLCALKVRVDEVIRSLFWNKLSQSLITVSVHSSDNYASLHCRSVSAACIRAGRPHDGKVLFEDASLKWPGFVEFDDVNSKVITFSDAARMYKVYDLSDYRLLYTISNTAVQDLKVSPGIMLMILQHEVDKNGTAYLPLRIHNIQDGSLMKEFRHQLDSGDRIDFAELFNDKLLVKQEGRELTILDIMPAKPRRIATTEFPTPMAFIFLYDRNLFLTFCKQHVAVWNFEGKIVTEFEDHELVYADNHAASLYITNSQDLVVSYCQSGQPNCAGSINISSVLTGKCMTKIAAPVSGSAREREGKRKERRKTGSDFGPSDIGSATKAALTDVTALFVCEEHHEIFTGTADGLIHKWSA